MVVVYGVASSDPYSFFYDETGDNGSTVTTTCTRAASSGSGDGGNQSLLGYNAEDGGIPSVLAINVAVWAVMIIAFCFVRRWAWNYGRIGILQKQVGALSIHRPIIKGKDEDDDLLDDGAKDAEDQMLEGTGFKSYFMWIWITIRLSHKSIVATCGRDAGHYLSFLRHLTILQGLLTLLSIGVILPANYSGKLVTEPFPRTTVTNLDKNSNVYWLHNIFSVMYMVMVIVAMSLFARQLRKRQKKESYHTLMITQVPRSVTAEDIQAHFEEAYAQDVIDVQFAYDVSDLSKLNKQRIAAARNYLKYKELSEAKGSPCKMHTRACGDKLPLCLCCGEEVEAEPYYQSRVESLASQCVTCHGRALQNRLDIAFVTLAESSAAERVRTDYRLGRTPKSSSLSDQVRSKQWSVELAPLPKNLKWENLSTGTLLWWARFVLVNAFLCTILFFWTTPVVIIGSLGTLNITGVSPSLASNPLVTIWLPTLILWLVTAVLPLAVSYTTYFESHWTKSHFEQHIMRKTFIFLLLMALVLPALGLASLDSFFTNFRTRESAFNQLECIFLPNNGGFFISYLTFCAFIGTGVELLRLPAMIGYFLALARAKTRREKEDAKKVVAGDFQYGVEYAWVVTIFGMSLVFSITCPLVTIFGLTYLLLKYFIDKYNLFFALRKSNSAIKIDVHHMAVNFVIMCAVLLQLTDLFFSVLRLRKLKDAHAIFALVMFVLSVVYVAASMIFGQLAYLTPFRRIYEPGSSDGSCLPKGSYVAPVLQGSFDGSDVRVSSPLTSDDNKEESDSDDDTSDVRAVTLDGSVPRQPGRQHSYNTFNTV
eukprot:scpid27024/ scgid3848/ Transmembrane protein 63C